MTREFIKRHIPNAKQLRKQYSFMGVLGDQLHRPSLWHLNRRSVAKAFAIGLFCMWLPIPFQTIVAGFLAVIFCANLPLSIVLVFISNPITMPPMMYFAYRLGSALLGRISEPMNFSLSVEWISHMISTSWQPILLGGLVLATISAILGYTIIRILWRLHIIQRWQHRNDNHP